MDDVNHVMSRSGSLFLPDPVRERRFWEALSLVWMLSLCDLVFTLWAHRFTPFIELNPIADTLLGQGLVSSVVAFKLMMMLIASLVFWRARHSPRTEFALWGLAGVYALLMIRWAEYTLEASQHIMMVGWGYGGAYGPS